MINPAKKTKELLKSRNDISDVLMQTDTFNMMKSFGFQPAPDRESRAEQRFKQRTEQFQLLMSERQKERALLKECEELRK